MKNGIVIADSGPIFSLTLIDKLNLLDELFDDVMIPNAVWEEITKISNHSYYNKIYTYFYNKVQKIAPGNNITFNIGYGESESLILYDEINADFLLIDDKKARHVAEIKGINCIGTIGLLMKAKKMNKIIELKPYFQYFIQNKRYYSVDLLNKVLIEFSEKPL